MSDTIEKVLILQGGGSLGAFGCGVFKAIAQNKIKIDIIAGTSIGGLNAAIIAGSKGDHPERELEQFWLELAEGSTKLNSPFIEWLSGYPLPTPTLIPPPIPITISFSNTNHTNISPYSNNTYFTA